MKLVFIIVILAIGIFCALRRGTILVGFAMAAAGKKNKARAIRLCHFADKIGGMSFEASLSCGYYLLKSGYLKDARIIFNRIGMDGKLSKIQKQKLKSLKALVTWKDGQLDEAIEMLEELRTEYVNSAVYQSLCLFYIIKRDKEKALELCLEAYEYNPDDDVILDNLAEAYALYGETEKAMETYEKLLEREPNFPEAYYGYGVLLIQSGRREEGVEYIGKSLDKNFSFLSALSRERVEDIYFAHKKLTSL